MSDHDDELIARVAAELKAPVDLGSALDARITARIAGRLPDPASGPLDAAWRWPIAVSPLAGLAVAAGVVAVLLFGNRLTSGPGEPRSVEMQFVYVDLSASSVALVGDFNGWDPTATPLARAPGDGIWAVTLPLPPGRYHYSFVVDGTHWARDPTAPRALGDHFDRPTSAVTIGGGDSE